MSDLLVHLQRLWVHGNQHVPGLLEGIASSADVVFTKYGTTAPLVVALMFGQFSQECGAGLEMEENEEYALGKYGFKHAVDKVTEIEARYGYLTSMCG